MHDPAQEPKYSHKDSAERFSKELPKTLKRYRYYIIASILTHILGLTYFIHRLYTGIPESITYIAITCDLIINISFQIQTHKTLFTRRPQSPNKIILYHLYGFIAATAALLTAWLCDDIYKGIISFRGSTPSKYLGKNLIPFLLTAAYFKQSKQVKEHYGQNADLKFL